MIREPILFIFGVPRSGTTFLNSIVREYYGYGLCSEGQWVVKYARRLSRYGDLEKWRNIQRLIHDILTQDMFAIFRTIYSQRLGKPVRIDEEHVWSELRERSYPGVVYAIFSSVARQMGKERVGNKNPSYWQILPQLATWFPEAKFLHIVRDGRDTALSLLKVPWGPSNVFSCAKMWTRALAGVETFQSQFTTARVLTVRYEDVLINPADVAERLSTFLGLTLSPDGPTRLAMEIQKGGRSHNFNKWKTHMSENDIRVFEAVAGSWLQHYGYEVKCECPKVSLSGRVAYDVRETLRRAFAKLRGV